MSSPRSPEKGVKEIQHEIIMKLATQCEEQGIVKRRQSISNSLKTSKEDNLLGLENPKDGRSNLSVGDTLTVPIVVVEDFFSPQPKPSKSTNSATLEEVSIPQSADVNHEVKAPSIIVPKQTRSTILAAAKKHQQLQEAKERELKIQREYEEVMKRTKALPKFIAKKPKHPLDINSSTINHISITSFIAEEEQEQKPKAEKLSSPTKKLRKLSPMITLEDSLKLGPQSENGSSIELTRMNIGRLNGLAQFSNLTQIDLRENFIGMKDGHQMF